VVASSPSQLIEGESVRLSAGAVDDRGEAVAGRAVTWKSEDDNVASVDDNGVVTARRPGTVTIVATADGRTGRVTLSVGARRAVEAPAPAPAPPARANSAAAAGQVMRARIDEFVTALRERNGSRVAALYAAESGQDRKNLQALLERMRRPETRLKAAEPQLGPMEVREMEAGVDFQIPMSWTTPFGRVRSQTSTFRAVLEPGDDGWRLVAIRATGKID
jgi:Big-like domain-containing protein